MWLVPANGLHCVIAECNVLSYLVEALALTHQVYDTALMLAGCINYEALCCNVSLFVNLVM